eukprot:5303237-Amphidinium_carterae.1
MNVHRDPPNRHNKPVGTWLRSLSRCSGVSRATGSDVHSGSGSCRGWHATWKGRRRDSLNEALRSELSAAKKT